MNSTLKTFVYAMGAMLAASSFLSAHGAVSVTASRTYVVQETTLHASETEGQNVLIYTLGSQSNKFVVAKDGLDRATRLTPVTEPGTTNVIGYYIGTNVNAKVASSDWMSNVSGLKPVYGHGDYTNSVIGYTLGDDTGKVVASSDWLSEVTEVKPIISSDDSPSRVVGYTIGTNAYVFASDKSAEVQRVKKVTGSTTNVVGYTIGGNTNNVFMSEYGVRQVIPNYPAVSNAAMRVMSQISDGANVVDAARNVYRISHNSWFMYKYMTREYTTPHELYYQGNVAYSNIVNGSIGTIEDFYVSNRRFASKATIYGEEVIGDVFIGVEGSTTNVVITHERRSDGVYPIIWSYPSSVSNGVIYAFNNGSTECDIRRLTDEEVSTNFVGRLALTNDVVTLVKPGLITDGTNTIYASRKFVADSGEFKWRVTSGLSGTSHVLVGTKDHAQYVPENPQDGDEMWSIYFSPYQYGSKNGWWMFYVDIYSNGDWSSDVFYQTDGNIDDTAVNISLGTYVAEWVSSEVVIGKLALMSDFSTSNDLLVATIEEKAPAPGNYSAVSNAAMNARGVTDLGVRGDPESEGSWFMVDGVRVDYTGYGEWDGGNFAISTIVGGYQFAIAGGQYEFVLDDQYSAVVNGRVIVGYTNTLAKESQIPTKTSDLQNDGDGTSAFATVDQIPSVPSASSTIPPADTQNGSAGSSTNYSRGDHSHPFAPTIKDSNGNVINADRTVSYQEQVTPFWRVVYNGESYNLSGTRTRSSYVPENPQQYDNSFYLTYQVEGDSWLLELQVYLDGDWYIDTSFLAEGGEDATNLTFIDSNNTTATWTGKVEHQGALALTSEIPTVPSPSSSPPQMDGAASPGTGTDYARGDHVHPTDTTRRGMSDLSYDGDAWYVTGAAEVRLVPDASIENQWIATVDGVTWALVRTFAFWRFGYTENGTTHSDVDEDSGADATNLSFTIEGEAYSLTKGTRLALLVDLPVVSPSDPTFSNAVLSVGLGIDTNDVAAINALVEQGDELPIGGAAGVGALLVAIAAAVAALKRRVTSAETALAQKASLTDLPYRLVEPGEWEFSDGLIHNIGGPEFDGEGNFYYYLSDTTPNAMSQYFITQEDAISALSLTFNTEPAITATRLSLPGHLLDRAVNAVSASTSTTLTLPALVNAGRSRDLLVRLTLSADSAVTFSAPTGETITWDDAGSPTATYEDGTHLFRFKEVAPSVFHFTDLGDGGSIDPAVLNGKLEATSAAPAFDATKTYSVGEHVTYEGVLYECSTAVTTAGAWTGSTNWKATDMTSPDATLDLMADGRLRLVSAAGEVLWMQGYGLASSSSVTLSCDRVNFHAFTAAPAFDATAAYAANDLVAYDGVVYVFTAAHAAGEWTGSDATVYAVALAMPTAPSGKVGDFVLDMDNTANASASATATLTGAGTAFDVFTPEGVNLSTDILTFAGGEQCELYFTMTAFGTAAKPAWKVVKQVVEKQEFGS